MVGPWGQEVMERSPDVDEIVTCTFPGFARRPKGSWLAPYRLLLQEARRVRRRQVDLALIMRYDHWWGALLAALAGIPQRIGYAIPEVCPFLTQAVPYSVGRHEVHQGLRLVSTLAGGPDEPDGSAGDPQTAPLHFEPTDSEDAWVKRWLLLHDAVPERPLVAIHPGSGSTVKLWLAEKWAAVADTLCERRGVQIVLTGSAGELDLAWAIAARTRIDPLVACGETTLGQLAALYGHCRLVMGPDCGPLHLAVAVGAPTVHLYGPVDVGTFGPWGDPFRHRVLTSRWPCIPCNRLDIVAAECVAHPCVRDIGVARVLAEAESLLSGMW
jgi:heptosyltransferase-2/heptosyltransferase-3